MTTDFFQKKIKEASDTQLDGIWVTLRSDVNILRKLKIICALLNLNIEDLKNILPKNENGYILDRESREFIHKILLPESKKRKTP
jgi:hypothetical protein